MIPPDQIDTEALDAQVERVFRAFSDATHMQTVLTKLIADFKANQDTNQELLKAMIWGKVDPKDDTAVDGLMYRFRKRLKQYYEKEGVRDPILITAPPAGKGKPRTTWIEVTIRELPPLLPSTPSRPPAPRSRLLRTTIGCAVLCFLVAGILLPLRITQPANGGPVGSKPTIAGRGGTPWRLHYLVVEPEAEGGRYVQFDDGPLHRDPLLGWEREVNIGDANTKSGTWFYIYAISTEKELQATVDYVPATGRLLGQATGDRPSHAIRVQLVK